ncbi:MAG TPA: efflux RND transporter periplasmic adaptor subunit, partial [Chitinophagaceae bacterium]|nr:efflux RND transporter periplasmic adaptor subunit [Chitinophagaceae bacterium]
MKRNGLLRFTGMAILFLLPIAILLLVGCNSKIKETAARVKTYYTCPMHSQIHEDKPGNCPICGMKLIKIEPEPPTAIPLDSALTYLEDPVTQTVVGDFKVVSPGKINSGDTITADGYTGFDERELNTVASRVGGRIEKLYVKYANQPIHVGQPLMKLYSPELLNVQRNLLQAVKDKDGTMVTALKENLYNLGMSPQQVQQVMQAGQPLVEETIFSPYSGISQEITTGQNSGVASGNAPMGDAVNNMGGGNSLNNQAGNGSSAKTFAAPELLRIQEGMY